MTPIPNTIARLLPELKGKVLNKRPSSKCFVDHDGTTYKYYHEIIWLYDNGYMTRIMNPSHISMNTD